MRDNPDGKLYRAGYLPVGSVVVLEEPSSKRKGGDCAFHYDDEISGYLDRKDFASLAKIMAEIKLEEVYGFVAPDTRDNSKKDNNGKSISDLTLFKDEGLNSVLDGVSVTNPRTIIFLMTDPTASKALQVKYAQNVRASRPTLQTAYIAAEQNRADNFSDGTFRIQRVRTSKSLSENIRRDYKVFGA
jgi:hypothetical protein